ncbi:copper resistance protein CopC [Kitasatospora sp. NPDC057500]|uniref:copper resistance CopC family protein n=1 Tax=Kitasatospora sp. NPDC057500 TaxID=3346151 RepID=UPI0036838CBB
MPETAVPVADPGTAGAREGRAPDRGAGRAGSPRAFQRTMAIGLGLLVVVLAAVGWLSSAEEVKLSGASPAAGGRVAQAPAEVALTFSGAVRSSTLMLAVNGTDGTSVTDGTPELDGGRLSVPVSITEPGAYRVTYRLALDRGRVVSGTTEFVVGDGPLPEGAEELAEAGSDSDDGHGHGVEGPFNIALLCLDALLLPGALVLMLRRPRVR